jgi:hypothetical protein
MKTTVSFSGNLKITYIAWLSLAAIQIICILAIVLQNLVALIQKAH